MLIPCWSAIVFCLCWQLPAETESFKLHLGQIMRYLAKIADTSSSPDARLRSIVPSTLDLITSSGYRGEKYQVTTEDGYLLSLHRIANESGPPVLVMHGIFSSSDQWLVLDASLNLPFTLAKAGYDVWLGDERGNALSTSHVHYSNMEKRFWDFSFHEGGYYDVPALIDFVLAKTGKDRLFYVGHSMGTTVFLVMGSTRPEYNSKIVAAALLAPVALAPPRYRWNRFLKLIDQSDVIYKTLTENGIYELLPRTRISALLSRNFCGARITQPLCLAMFDFVLGVDKHNIDLKKLGYYMSTYPAGSSSKTLYHFGQIFKSGRFAMFDYGPDENQKRYGSPSPPSYNLSIITAPVAIYYGLNDRLISRESADSLARSVGNLLSIDTVEDPMYGHIDFQFGLNSKTLVYSRIVQLFDSLK